MLSIQQSKKENNDEKELIIQQYKKENNDENKLTPCLFSWCEGGREVYLIGSFVNWDMNKKLKMEKCNGEFLLTLLLKKDIYTYKFLVDGQLKYSSSVATTRGPNGEINNVIDMKNYIPFNFELKMEKKFRGYKQIWRYSKLNNFDMVSRITPIPLFLENSRDIIKKNVNNSCLISELLCSHMYFDTDTYKKHSPNVTEMCIVLKSEFKNKKGEKKKIFTKYNILTYLPNSNNEDFIQQMYNPLKHLIKFEQ